MDDANWGGGGFWREKKGGLKKREVLFPQGFFIMWSFHHVVFSPCGLSSGDLSPGSLSSCGLSSGGLSSGGLSLGLQKGLSSGGLSSKRSFVGTVYRQGCLSSKKTFVRAVYRLRTVMSDASPSTLTLTNDASSTTVISDTCSMKTLITE